MLVALRTLVALFVDITHRAAKVVRLRRLTGLATLDSKHWPIPVRRAAVAVGVGFVLAGLVTGQALVIVADLDPFKMVWA
jgi:hypothetical protein